MFAFFGVYSVKNYIQTREYVKVEAVVTRVWYQSDSYSNTSSHYRDFSYQYDGNDYVGTQQILIGSRIGKKDKNLYRP